MSDETLYIKLIVRKSVRLFCVIFINRIVECFVQHEKEKDVF